MKAIFYHEYGSSDVLELKDIDRPVIKDNEVLVGVHAASVNRLDWHLMRGSPYIARLQAGLRKPKDTVLGADVAGQVEAVGKHVTKFQPGDEVFRSLFGHGLALLRATISSSSWRGAVHRRTSGACSPPREPFHLAVPAALRVAERLAGESGERDLGMSLEHALLEASTSRIFLPSANDWADSEGRTWRASAYVAATNAARGGVGKTLLRRGPTNA
jgi:hypothetical protein